MIGKVVWRSQTLLTWPHPYPPERPKVFLELCQNRVARRAFLREHTGVKVPYFSDNFRELFKHHRASANHEQRPI